MKQKALNILIVCLVFLSFSCSDNVSVGIKWVNHLEGDFSFMDKWSYPYPMFRNDFGELVCDGLCPPETDKMRNENGRIIPDSIARYYQLIDTTHLYHSIEWGMFTSDPELGYISAESVSDDIVNCRTLVGADYWTMVLIITGNRCIPVLEYYRIDSKIGRIIYNCNKGTIRIDKKLWEQDILKAEFDLTFYDPTYGGREEVRKGKIYTEIDKSQ